MVRMMLPALLTVPLIVDISSSVRNYIQPKRLDAEVAKVRRALRYAGGSARGLLHHVQGHCPGSADMPRLLGMLQYPQPPLNLAIFLDHR